jgi:hypothetical protein
MAKEKAENQEFVVKVNSVFTIMAKDGLDAHNKVVGALAMMRPAGTVSRKIRWSNVQPSNGQMADKDKE